jgi:uncharacterized protein YggE
MQTSSTQNPWRIAFLVGAAVVGVGLIAGPVLAGVIRPSAGAPYPLAAGTDTPLEHTISVAGSGKVTLVPDMATVNLGVVVQKDTAKAARQAAAERMTGVVAALKKLGIDDKDIATSTISLSPVYDWSNNTQRITGYQLNNMVTVTVRDLDKLGDILDDTITAGATSVDGITFDVADRVGAEAKAREAAMVDAKAKADTLAKGGGVRVTGVQSISESVSTPVWYDYRMAAPTAGAAEDASTPVMPGTTDVTITVQVVYTIS